MVENISEIKEIIEKNGFGEDFLKPDES